MLISANAVVNLVNSTSSMLGPVIGGILFSAFGLPPILIVSCICFAIAAVMELFIKIPHVKQTASKSVFQIIKGDMSQSIRFIVKEKPILAKSIGIIFAFNLVVGSMITVGLPVLITQNLGVDSSFYGIAEGIIAVGGMTGGILTGMLGKKIEIQKIKLMLLFCTITMIPMGLVFLFKTTAFNSYIVITAMCFMILAGCTMFSIQMVTFVQSQTPNENIGKVMSCVTAASNCSQPIGQMLFGILFEHFASTPWVVLFLSSLMSLMVAIYSQRHFK